VANFGHYNKVYGVIASCAVAASAVQPPGPPHALALPQARQELGGEELEGPLQPSADLLQVHLVVPGLARRPG
jgi:hypothetical protein